MELLSSGAHDSACEGFEGVEWCAQVVSNGRRNLRYRDGRPLCAALSEGLKSSSAPVVRTLAHACHYSRTLLHKAAQVGTPTCC